MSYDPRIVDRVREMKHSGARHAEIAMSVGMTENALKKLCYKNDLRKPSLFHVEVTAKLGEAYRAEAKARGLPFGFMMRKLLATIVEDKLFTAILDD